MATAFGKSLQNTNQKISHKILEKSHEIPASYIKPCSSYAQKKPLGGHKVPPPSQIGLKLSINKYRNLNKNRKKRAAVSNFR